MTSLLLYLSAQNEMILTEPWSRTFGKAFAYLDKEELDMTLKLARSLILIFAWLTFSQLPAESASNSCFGLFSKLNTFYVQHGGFVTLRDGSLIEGSIANGGLQPHTFIDYKHASLAAVVTKAHAIRHLKTKEKIEILTALAHTTLVNREYSNPVYLETMAQALRTNPEQRISFGEYIRNRAGTCREHALFMHIALLEAGVPNQMVYGKYKHFNFDRRNNTFTNVAEDHAFVVVDWNSAKYIVDSYFHEAHGQSLDHIIKFETINVNSPRAPWAYDLWAQVSNNIDQLTIHLESVHNFPAYFVPQK